MTPEEADARAEARRMLDESAVTRPDQIDLDRIAERLEAEVIYDQLDGATASVMRIGDRSRIRISTRVRDIGAQRFSIAHELGHLRLGHEVPYGNARQVVERMCKPLETSRKVAERLASVFASEVVMPEHLVRRYCDVPHVTLAPAREIAGKFRTSLLASAMRFVELSGERCAVAYSVLGRVKWVKRSSTFPDWIPSGRKLDPGSAASEHYQTGIADTAVRVIEADAWLPRSRVDRPNVQIVEQSAVIPELGAVLTMLWLPGTEFGQLDLTA